MVTYVQLFRSLGMSVQIEPLDHFRDGERVRAVSAEKQ